MSKKLIYNPENPKGILVDLTEAELSQKVIDDEKSVIRKTEFNAKRYQRDKASEYPSIGDQLDMLWHAVDTGDWTAAKVKTTEFYTALKAVKDANPKP